MSTAQSLIESAFARSTASDAGKLSTDLEMINHLNRKFQSLFARYAASSGDNSLAKSTLVWAGGPPATVALPTDIVDIVKLETAASGRVYLIPARERDRTWHLAPACFRVGNTLMSRGALAGVYGAAADPVAADVTTIYYKDAPATLSALSSTLDTRFPVRFEMLLIIDMALYLSQKDEGRQPSAMQALQAELAREEAAFALAVGESNTGRESAHTGQAPDSQKTA